VTANQVLFSNGVLEINGGELEFTPTQHRVIYGPRISLPYTDELFDEKCQEFESLIENALPEAEERTYLQRVCGLILQPHTILRGQIVFWGVPHSGKTTLATAIATAPAGVRGQCSVSEERLITDKWATTMLVNKFASVSNDSEFTPKWEAFMKQYTSGSFTAEAKFSKPTTVPTTAKLISTCNDMQSIRDVSGAAAMRYRIFQFKNQIAESNSTNQTERMSASYWADPERRKGIVAWMLNGLIDAIQFGIVEPFSMKQTKRKALAEACPLMEFVDEGIEAAPGQFLKCSDVNDALGLDRRHPHTRQLHQTIERVWKVTKVRKRIGDEQFYGYENLKLS
jgi:phage/plasmid-associated DNA primase